MSDAEHTVVVGVTGAGKSELTSALLKKARRVIAMTTKYTDYTAKDGYKQVTTVKALITALKGVRGGFVKGDFKICLRVEAGPDDMGRPIKVMHDVSLFLHKLQENYARGLHQEQITLAVDESHRFYPHHRPKGMDGLTWVISEGRAWGINLLFITQRPSNMPPVFRDNATNMYVLLLGGGTGVTMLRSFLGKELKLVTKYRVAAYRSLKFVTETSTRRPRILHKLP